MQITLTLIFILLVFLMVPVGILILRDWFVYRKKRLPERLAQDQKVWTKRLLNPDFPGLEEYFHFEVPSSIVAIYNNTDLIQRTDFDVKDPAKPDVIWPISTFLPADRAVYTDMWEETRHCFCVATNSFGDVYYVDIAAADLPIYIYYHDGSDTEMVSPSLKQFLSWIK
jgi:hypothetical protein